ncbi:MAG TPA: hypothetical protein VNK05_06225 [Chloroflexota bacterium]|nr:hypothetical protein [Chloroflexota bacterium]
MNRTEPTPPRVMPWLASIVPGGLYTLELWRDRQFAEPTMLLTQAALAAPLVIAGSVLPAVAVDRRARPGRLRHEWVALPRGAAVEEDCS